MVEALLFTGAGAGAGEKNPELVKNGLAPQHCRQYTVSVPLHMFF